MTTASMTPASSITKRPMKSRIEAMFADDRSPARPAATADRRRGIAS
jgi:hypothetical protein